MKFDSIEHFVKSQTKKRKNNYKTNLTLEFPLREDLPSQS